MGLVKKFWRFVNRYNPYYNEVIKAYEKSYDQNTELKLELQRKSKIMTPQMAVKSVLESHLKWYDYTKLDRAPLEEYKRYADTLLKNPVFQNEINFLIQNLAKQALDSANSYEELRDMRMMALALKQLEYRIDEIPKPDTKKKDVQNPYEAI